MKTFQALIKREILDGKNGYIWAPVVLAAITVLLLFLSVLGFGNMIEIHGMEEHNINNFGDALTRLTEKEPEDISAAMTFGYWSMGSLPWIAFPFVVFFSLLSSLYEERRDRSILFWKSMPVADWQEVLAKLFVPVVIVPIIFMAVVIVSQVAIAFFLTIVVLFQGGPILELWPLGLMISTWFSGLGMYYIYALWALPMLAWVLLVSSFANRLPFLWAALVPAVMAAVEGIFFETTGVLRWIAIHIGGWTEFAYRDYAREIHIDGPRDLLDFVVGGPQLEAISYTLSSGEFWAGLIVSAAFVFAAIEIRKKAT